MDRKTAPWLRVDAALMAHPKFRRLVRKIGSESLALAAVIRLWSSAKLLRPDGDFSGWTDSQIGDVLADDPDGAGTVEYLSECGFLDGTPGSKKVHGWDEYQGRTAQEREAARVRQKDKRERDKRDVTRDVRNVTPVTVQDRTGQDVTEKQKQARSARPVSPDKPAPGPPVFNLPTRSGNDWPVTGDQVKSWSEAFPGVDVLGELRRMGAWLAANPTRGKTVRGMGRFVVSWLSRAEPCEVAAVKVEERAAAREQAVAALAAQWGLRDNRRDRDD